LGIPSARAVEALVERESLGPTGVGHGVALPHARLAEIDRVQGVFLRLEKPVDFGSVDRKPVDLVFALFAPEDAGVEHLKALAVVSRTLKDQAMRTKLRANNEAVTLHAVLTEDQANQAA
jgi:PTS system nitrogen regulatory IIA component